MADEAAAPAANPVSVPDAGLSVGDAVAALRERRQPNPEPATPEPAGAADESSSEDDDAGPHEAPGEYEESDEAGEPPIDAPRTWSKAERDAFASLPREHQQMLADRERERDAHYQRGLQDAAEQRKAATAERQAAEQARQQYEHALPSLLQQFQTQFATEFQDIKSWTDVESMQENDPLRFQRYQLAREKGQTLQRETAAAQHRQREEQTQQWQKFVSDEDAKFLAAAPEFKDAKKAGTLAAEANAMMADLKFSAEEVSGLWNGQSGISLRDHRIQLLVRDALRYRAAEKARKAAVPKPVPPVQRPGVAQPKGEQATAHVRDLSNKLKSTGSVQDAVALLRAKRNATAKAS